MQSRSLLRFLVFPVCFTIVVSAEARSFRVQQIPNGIEIGCTTCHVGF